MARAALLGATGLLALILGLGAGDLTAQDLTPPEGADLTVSANRTGSEHLLPIAPANAGADALKAFAGARSEEVWTIAPPQDSATLRDVVLAQLPEMDLVFSCETASCGGFDFRFLLDLESEPLMHLDIGDFAYALAQSKDGTGVVALVVSRSSLRSYVEVTRIGPQAEAPPTTTPTGEVSLPFLPEIATPVTLPPDLPVTAQADGALAADLTTRGHAVLGDLVFKTGSADLGEGEFATLTDLADWLTKNPTVRVAIVGHTDAVGSLDANTALSKRRAASVVERLTRDYDIAPSRLEALGAGYMAPLANNLDEAGRALNRRVEVVLLSEEAE